jgi:NAD+ kinase
MMPPIARVGLIARLKAEALAALVEAAAWIETQGRVPVIEAESARASGATRWATADRDQIATTVDVLVAFGGDGTLLDAANTVVQSGGDPPLVGINFGRLGFLTDVERSEMTGTLERLLAGEFRIETRTMIQGRLRRSGTVVCERIALNDIVLTRSALSRMVEIDVDVDRHFVCHVKADGLIVSTATGSTAYNLSGGGPIVHPSVDAVVLTPIAPHTLTQRPLVLPASAAIELRPLVGSHTEMVATFDGQFGVSLQPTDVIEIARAPRVLRLARTSSRTYFGMLREKLKWGNP